VEKLRGQEADIERIGEEGEEVGRGGEKALGVLGGRWSMQRTKKGGQIRVRRGRHCGGRAEIPER